ncbi:MAG: OB-fold nucleic acid binding domain-containing protein, partial [bacterium]|nr:OB-fold nucleic acid binding domain-containing protein [bacterium]
TEGAKARGVDEKTATHIFDLMEKFAGYGFNKSHSAAYALVAYQTAWLKAHYPAAFMAAVMSSDMDNTDKVVTFIDECAHMKLNVLPPSVNSSMYPFTVSDNKTIIYGLGAIKGVGESAIDCITQERQSHGVYNDLFGFCQRLDLRKVNRRVLEALIKSGGFDNWDVERATLTASLEKALKVAEKEHQNQSSGQFDLFSLLEDNANEQDYISAQPWSERQRLEGEREVLGFYLTGHPADQYRREFGDFIVSISQLNPSIHKKAIICAQVSGVRKIVTKRGKKLVIIGMDDSTSRMDVVVFGEVFDLYTEPLISGSMIVIEGEVAHDDYNGGVKMTAIQLYNIPSARIRFARCLELRINQLNQSILPSLQSILKAHTGRCAVQFAYANTHAKAHLSLAPQWHITPSDELLSLLGNLLGSEQVIMRY